MPPGKSEFNVEMTPTQSSVAGGQFKGDAGDLISGLEEISRLEGVLEKRKSQGQTQGGKPGIASRLKTAEEVKVPDYSADGRDQFRRSLINQIGFDPQLIDPEQVLMGTEQKQVPQLFERFFRGQVRWEDRDKLNTNQKKQWESELLNFRAHVTRQAKGMRAQGNAILEQGLDTFDRRAKEFKAAREKIEKEIEAERKLRSSPPKTKTMVNAQGEKTVHEWRPDIQDWVDTGKKTTVTSPNEIIKQLDYEAKVLEGRKLHERIEPEVLEDINKRREIRGIPKLKEVKLSEGEKKRKFKAPEWMRNLPGPGKAAKGAVNVIGDWLAKDSKGEYQYVEEGEETGGMLGELEGGGAEMAEEDIATQIKSEYPNAFQGDDGNWYYTDTGGQAYQLVVE